MLVLLGKVMGIAENSKGNQDFGLVFDKKKVFLEQTFLVAQEIGVNNIPAPLCSCVLFSSGAMRSAAQLLSSSTSLVSCTDNDV